MLGWINSRAEKRAHARIRMHLQATRAPVTVVPTQGMFNHRCHENSVEWIRQHPGCTLVEVIYFDDEQPILHYVVRDLQGQLLEVSIGWTASNMEYFLIRDIPNPYKVYAEFDLGLKYWLTFSTTWLDRFLGLSRVL